MTESKVINQHHDNEEEHCPDKDELAGGRFWSKEEISENIGKNIFTPNFENEYKRFFLNQKEH